MNTEDEKRDEQEAQLAARGIFYIYQNLFASMLLEKFSL